MGLIEVKLSEEHITKLMDIVKEKGSDLVSMKTDMESKGVPDISRSIIDYIDSEIDNCTTIHDVLWKAKRGGVYVG